MEPPLVGLTSSHPLFSYPNYINLEQRLAKYSCPYSFGRVQPLEH